MLAKTKEKALRAASSIPKRRAHKCSRVEIDSTFGAAAAELDDLLFALIFAV